MVIISVGCMDSIIIDIIVLENVVVMGLSDNVLVCIDEGFDLEIIVVILFVDDGIFEYYWMVLGEVNVIVIIFLVFM